MAKTEKIALANPIELFGKPITHLTLNEPTGQMYTAIGEPRVLVRTGSGSGYYVEQPAEIASYLHKCIDGGFGEIIVKQLSLEDIMGVKRLLLSFFDRAQERLVERMSTSSSSP